MSAEGAAAGLHTHSRADAPARKSAPALASPYGGLICDLDGVVYHGDRAVPGAPEALQRMAAHGMAVVYATNNASRLPQDVAATLTGLGAPATADSVVTSAQAGASRVRSLVPPGAQVVALGGPGVFAALEDAGLVPIAPGGAVAVAVLQGYGPALTVGDFTHAARHLRDGAIWVATNTDATLPQSWGMAPGNGAYVDILRAVAGRDPVVVGKPEPPLYELAIERLGARLGGRPALAVGDRLDTDIDGAAAAGLDAAWVLTGVHLPSDLLARPTTAPPRYVIGGLAELEQPYAAVRVSADGWACGSRRARVDARAGRLLILDGTESSSIELVRVGMAALVEARDVGDIPSEDLVAAARELDDIVNELLSDGANHPVVGGR